MGGPYGPSSLNTQLPLYHTPFFNTQFPFLATLELLDLYRLTNNPIQHHPSWLVFLVNIPTYILQFDAKLGEDTTTHITIYHLWCVSNLLLDDSIQLRFFLHTLTDYVSMWFIEFPTTLLNNFNSLEMAYVTHIQLPIWYETCTNIITSL